MKKGLFLLLLFDSHFSFFSPEKCFAQSPLVKKWDYRFGGTDYDALFDLALTADGGLVLGGMSFSEISGDKTQPGWGSADYWVVKTDSLGNKQWDKDFGGTDYETVRSLQETTDAGYILGGYSISGLGGDKTQAGYGDWDYWIIKTDSLGNKQWDRDFGGTNTDYLISLRQTADGGYILGGNSMSGISGDKTQDLWGTTGEPDYWIIKTDSLGNKQWDKDFGGTGTDYLISLQQTADGGYILGGISYSGIGGDKTQSSWGPGGDYWLVKTDSLGNKEWDKRFGGTGDDHFGSLDQTSDGGYILAGTSNSAVSGDKTQATWGQDDFWIVKTDSLGNKQWDKNFGGTGNEFLYGTISQTIDEGYLIAGSSDSPLSGDKSESNLGGISTWVVKTDPLGNKQWDKTLQTTSHSSWGFTIQLRSGCYLIANSTLGGIGGDKTQESRGSEDYWVIKFCDTTSSLPFFATNNKLCEKSCTNFFDQSLNNPTTWQWIFPGGNPASSSEQNPTNICYNTPGMYDVTLITTNASGNDTLSLSNYINVYAAAPLPFITLSGYTLTSSPAVSYQWQFNSSDIAGATNQSYAVLQTGYHTVVVGDSGSCRNSATQYVLIKSNSMIYPNPSSGNFTIEFLNAIPENSWLEIKVVNTLGQEIFSSGEKISEAAMKMKIDLCNDGMHCVAAGVYFLEIKSGEKFFRKKVVIAR